MTKLLVFLLSVGVLITSQEFIPYVCSLNDPKCVSTLQLRIYDLTYLKSSTMHTAFKSTFDLVPTFSNPYVCLNPTKFSTYINYNQGVVVSQTNYTSVKNFTTCDWVYRVGVYQTQLVVMRLLNEYNNITQAFVQEILNYTGDPTVTCYNPIGTGNYYYKIDTIFSGVDLTITPDYIEQNSRLVNSLTYSINVLTSCLDQETANQVSLQAGVAADQERVSQMIVAGIATSGVVVAAILGGIGYLIKKRCEKGPESMPLLNQAQLADVKMVENGEALQNRDQGRNRDQASDA